MDEPCATGIGDETDADEAGNERRRLDEATRRSQAQANERPAPAAGPLTAAITGFSSERIRRTFGW